MRGIESSYRPFINAAKEKTAQIERPYLYGPELNPIAAEFGEEIIGFGEECVVVQGRTDPEVIVALRYSDIEPRHAKSIFYMHQMLSTIFPHNFPHFYASFGGEHSKTARQKIERGKHIYSRSDGTVLYPFSDVTNVVSGWNLRRFMDEAKHNFIIGADGGEYYVDELKPIERFYENDSYTIDTSKDGFEALGNFIEGLHVAKIVKYVEKEGYSEKDVNTVKYCIERLRKFSKAATAR